MAARPHLSDPTRDTITDLATAIGNGALIGSSTTLLSETNQPCHHPT